MEKSVESLLKIVKYGLGNVNECHVPDHTNWDEVLNLASKHGVAAIALDGIQRCIDENIPINIDLQTKLERIGITTQQESEYKRQEKVIASLVKFYQQYGIRMMVLKGWGLSQNYPNPSHRPCSDLDIYLFGDQEKADKLIEHELGIKVDHSHHHHTVFVYKGLIVENHYNFLNVYSHRSTRKIEKRLKELVMIGTKDIQIANQTVILPSVDFNALFVLRHMAVEFAATGMVMRQVLDWGLFVKKYHSEINWDSLLPFVKELNMHHFLDEVNYVCYFYLGFEKNLFKGFGSTYYGEIVYADLFNPKNFMPKEIGFVKYVWQRRHNWWHNRWRHKIVYSDSVFSTLVCQLIAHIMKPKTLYHYK